VTDDGAPPLKGWRRAMIDVVSEITTGMEKSRLRLQGSMKSLVIRSKTNAFGLTKICLPEQFGPDSQIKLYGISGRSIPFGVIPSESRRTITFRSNGIAFLKVRSKQETAVFKVIQ
jgi:hypothetical protein